VTDRTPALLVCVYYRVAAGDSRRVISAVREFQRTLHRQHGGMEAEVLLRCDLPSEAPPDARPPSTDSPDPPASAEPDADATVMETYRLPWTAAAGPDADAALRAFLATLETLSEPISGLLRGARHVELFAPCAS
jgi:hypothetical protein